jgi:hypothetical protein
LKFLELFKDKVELLDGHICDFKIKRTGRTIELKTEFRCETETPNLFIERYSYGNEDGGPFQALKKGATYYLHWFPKTQAFYLYRTTKLVEYLNANVPRPWLINIRNEGHTSRGFVIKRAALADLQLSLEDIL